MSLNDELMLELETLRKEKQIKKDRQSTYNKKYNSKQDSRNKQNIIQKRYLENLKMNNYEKFIELQEKKKEYNRQLYKRVKQKKLEEKNLKST